jgi:hypothetical protein
MRQIGEVPQLSGQLGRWLSNLRTGRPAGPPRSEAETSEQCRPKQTAPNKEQPPDNASTSEHDWPPSGSPPDRLRIASGSPPDRFDETFGSTFQAPQHRRRRRTIFSGAAP